MPRHVSAWRAWAARWWRALLSEACATALLVWLGVASAMPAGGAAAPLANVAGAFGFVVCGCCVGFGAVHMNPALSLAAALAGRLAWPAAAAGALAQTLGAVLGFAALAGTVPGARDPGAGLTLPAPGVSPGAAGALEAALTGLLALACCAAWAARDPDPALPVKLGLLVAGLVFAGGAASGASLNPARSFAPALWHGRWEHQWVYWAGPLGGAALAALMHRFVLTAPHEELARTPGLPEAEAGAEALPLDDKA